MELIGTAARVAVERRAHQLPTPQLLQVVVVQVDTAFAMAHLHLVRARPPPPRGLALIMVVVAVAVAPAAVAVVWDCAEKAPLVQPGSPAMAITLAVVLVQQ